MSLLNLLEEFIMFEKIRKMKNKKGFTPVSYTHLTLPTNSLV